MVPIEPGQLYRFHLLGLNHLPVTREFMGCAFTQKIFKMCQMLTSLGHEVFLYAAEGSDAPCSELIVTHTMEEIRNQWGDEGGDGDLGYDWKSEGFRHDIGKDNKDPLSLKVSEKMIVEINRRKKPGDFLMITQGYYQKPIADKVKLYLTIEPGIGYRGSWARFKAFESTYIMNFTYGSKNPFGSVNGFWYDRVIPNYFDDNDFYVSDVRGDYYLFVGRQIKRKGIDVAVETARALGKKLIIAGQGSYPVNYDGAEMVGYVDHVERAKLMSEAIATFVPTYYLEPFGGVAVESMMCGTPAITTDFGAFTDTVLNGVTGYRCHVLQDFVNAALLAEKLDKYTVAAITRNRYSMHKVKYEFQKWFDDLNQLYLSHAYEGVKGWRNLPPV